MCGFVVFVGGGTAPDPRLFGAMRATLHHRGPDDAVDLTVGPCTFGFQRLAIIDTHGSQQPLNYPPHSVGDPRWTVVCNGEIYNFRALREELALEHGCKFATEGDAEVLAAALDVWGPAGLDRLRGMFSFVAWDATEGVLHAGRDPFGIKPLFFAETEAGLWLSSEKKALMPVVETAGIDTAALSYYLTLQYVPEPYTMHGDVRRLAAGERLVYRPGASVEVHGWSVPIFDPPAATPPAAGDVVRDIRDALRDSVRAHMVADVPVGAFLSSGIDSTAVVALAREVKPDIKTFTVGFEATGFSEVEAASVAAEEMGVRHFATMVSDEDVLEALPVIAWHLDDPVADPALIPLFFLARAAARHVTVVLSGEGADELFGGYEIYREPASLAPVRRLPQRLQSGLKAVAQVIPEGVKGRSFLDRATTPIEQRYFGNARIFTDADKATLMRGPAAPYTEVTAPVYAAAEHLDDVATMQFVDLRTWLPGDILTKADRMSMAHSLELRVPFLDSHVFGAAARVPTVMKLPPGERTTKVALRRALEGVVPASVVDRRKLGFPTPTRLWLRGPIGEWAAALMNRSQAGDLLDLGYAQRLLAEHRRGEVDHARRIWTVVMFCLWHEIFVADGLTR
ncbi:asparagine synthase (glutamine-hydrolyzing) [Spirilliplanes yamanashiensis]|uniref:asparagine synthase (glutamine-hydrolyzing) n=1 Tax=Spirilliplanes yamanashiensis TaxID=42233 RepID=A0A8J3YEJ5_9ACTN|nr:asparagine synthase (glutamine-hydrolyzing) [Spirilliplanes yamanashiensis]GIJ06634.1 putative asparagine synthetase AsnB [Spirilliplanes yamanashiensis]